MVTLVIIVFPTSLNYITLRSRPAESLLYGKLYHKFRSPCLSYREEEEDSAYGMAFRNMQASSNGAAPELNAPVDPELPDTKCMFPGMRFEWLRFGTFCSIVNQPLLPGVSITGLVKGGYFYTTDGWTTCFDCGLVYGLGHLDVCKAQYFSVPFGQCASAMQKEIDDFVALRLSMERGIMRLREPVAVVGVSVPGSQVQPSCGPMDLSFARPLSAGGVARRDHGPLRGNPDDMAGFRIVKRNAVRCEECGEEIELGKRTALQLTTSHIVDEHRIRSPLCRNAAVGGQRRTPSPMEWE